MTISFFNVESVMYECMAHIYCIGHTRQYVVFHPLPTEGLLRLPITEVAEKVMVFANAMCTRHYLLIFTSFFAAI